MQRLEVSGAVRPIYGSLGVKRLIIQLQNWNKGFNDQNKGLLVHDAVRFLVQPLAMQRNRLSQPLTLNPDADGQSVSHTRPYHFTNCQSQTLVLLTASTVNHAGFPVLQHVSVMKGRRRYGATYSYSVDVPHDWFILQGRDAGRQRTER